MCAFHDPDNAAQREQQAGPQPVAETLLIKRNGQHNGQGWPEVINHAQFQRLCPIVGKSNRQRQTDFISHKQPAAHQQIATGQDTRIGQASCQAQQQGGDGIDQGGTAGGAQSLTDATQQTQGGAPE